MNHLKRVMAFLAMLSILMLGDQMRSQAQISGTASFQIATMQSLSVWGEPANGHSVVSILAIPQPTAQERHAGELTRSDALQLQILSNITWTLRTQTLENTMGTSFDGSYRKPLADLQIRAGKARWATASTAPQDLLSGEPGQHLVSVDYRIKLGAEHRDGNYSVTLIYTIATR